MKTDYEINAAIAELREQKPTRYPSINDVLFCDMRSPGGAWYCTADYAEGDIPKWIPINVATDISAAWGLEESIPAEQRENYIDALFEITKVDDSTMYWDGVSWATYDGLWAFIHATPRTRCLAWLKLKGVEV